MILRVDLSPLEGPSSGREQTQKCKSSFILIAHDTLSISFYFYLQPNVPY